MSDTIKCEPVSPLELAAFVPYACGRLEAPFVVRVATEQDLYVSKADEASKRGKLYKSAATQRTSRSSTIKEASRSASVGGGVFESDRVVPLGVVADSTGRPIALRLYPPLPRLLMKVIQLSLPFHRTLERLEARRMPLEGVIIHEIDNILQTSHITELRFDDCRSVHDNIAALLDCPHLRRLSLARCYVRDRGCELLAERLAHPPTELSLLTLAANAITTDGAEALAIALRTNRTLRHLDLAGNRITDDGATALLAVLVPFPLTVDELALQRQRTLEYWKLRGIVFERCRRELELANEARLTGERRATRKRARGKSGATSTEADADHTTVEERAHQMAGELLGPPVAPFGDADTFVRDGHRYSKGNRTLCSLNLSYNELRPPSVAKVREVLALQAEAPEVEVGLLRLLLEGNPLPMTEDADLLATQELLDRAMARRLGGHSKKDFRKH